MPTSSYELLLHSSFSHIFASICGADKSHKDGIWSSKRDSIM